MSDKKKTLITLVTLLIPLFITATAMIIFDPYFHYHKPINGIPYTLEEDVYINAGVLKNFDYDSVIVGSSLASLMEPSIPDSRLGTNTVLVTMRGASTKNGSYLIEYALKNNPKLKNIYYSLDYYALTGDKDELSRELPEYLYDKNPLNDTQYIWNKNTWIDGVYSLFNQKRTTPLITNFDDAYGFDSYVQFSRTSVLEEMPENFILAEDDICLTEYTSKEDYIEAIKDVTPEQNVVGNITCNIIPLLEAYPDVQFNFYMAPMPVLAWYSKAYEGGNEEIIQVCANLYYVFNELSKYTNCHLSFFYADDVTRDVYRYCDLIHWDRKIGRNIMNSMIDGNHIVTTDNTDEWAYNFYRNIQSFDYDMYNYKMYPFQNVRNYDEFLDSIKDKRYVKIALVNGCVNTEVLDKLKDVGLVSDECQPGKYYYSIVCDDKIVYERKSEQPFEDEHSIDIGNLHVVTSGFSDEASITINEGEYCPEEDPIDIVVIDSSNGMVVDSVGYNDDTGELIQY